MVPPLFKALRPHQWVKNLFVAAPLIFARRVDDLGALSLTAAAVAAFSLLSSAVYLFNDLKDLEKDRAHPVKRRRPLASGALTVRTAQSTALALSGAALAAAVLIGLPFFAIASVYLLLNLGYTAGLKRVAFVDVACISLGFLLRVLAGAAAIRVEPSNWLLACTLLLAALLGFGKRAHELRVAGAAGEQREVLGQYRLSTLRRLLAVLGILTTLTYVAYTQSEHALGFFGTRKLAFTVPFVAFGIFRFIGMTGSKLDAESPTDSMLRDLPFVANLLAYAAVILAIIYLGR